MEKPSLNYIKELSGGDKAFESKLITIVQEELPEEIAVYKKNMGDSAFAKAAENVHKLKHKLGILSLEENYEFAIEFEAQLKEGQTQNSDRFETILEECLDFISKL